ncbi:ankyrin repeat-containing domain protein [Leptodontidium sp. 2 PMI_412]|nr:ankyrin repeat-containing domain protein [Leptodontidium sp. 2 PMI_412]
MALLLKQRGDEIHITEDIIKAAAANEGSGLQVILLLLEHCAGKLDPVATTCGQELVLELLHKRYGFNDSTTWISVAQLYDAVKSGQLDVVQRFLQRHVAPDLRSPRGATPLWQATSNGHTAVANALLANGVVDTNSQDENGQTLLFQAAVNDHFEIVRLLLSHGASNNYKDKDRRSPCWSHKNAREYTLVGTSSLSVSPQESGK